MKMICPEPSMSRDKRSFQTFLFSRNVLCFGLRICTCVHIKMLLHWVSHINAPEKSMVMSSNWKLLTVIDPLQHYFRKNIKVAKPNVYKDFFLQPFAISFAFPV